MTAGEPLDNPLWSSLTTLHRALARGAGQARRYPADIAPFLAVAAPVREPLETEELELVSPGETVFLIGPRPTAPHGWSHDDFGEILQMVCTNAPPVPDGLPIVPLGADHRPAIVALAALVYPHYFRPRTAELGRYFGIFDGATLAAMAGERMGMPGHREISTICTHPDYLGRGFARRLLLSLTADIASRCQLPFLHVSPGNTRAVELYERNGYRTRRTIAFAAWQRP